MPSERPTHVQETDSLYRAIVADPPWRVQTGPLHGGMGEGFKGGDGKSRPLPYKTMGLEEIKTLPVAQWAADDCALYLWTINAYVVEAYEVARAWGFTPSTLLTWAKAPMGSGLGGAYRISTEHVLYARRGQPQEKTIVFRNWWDWKRPYVNGKPAHSKKPDALVDLVEAMHDGPYLELFARRARLGWDYWGDQSLQTVEVAA